MDLSNLYQTIASNVDMSGVHSDVESMLSMTKNIPSLVRNNPENFEKAKKVLGNPRAPKSIFVDPLSIQYSLGYKDRRYSLTYNVLKRTAAQIPVIQAIINTRIAQIASFSQPYRITKSLGFAVRHKDTEHLTTKSEKEFIKYLELYISSCGEPGVENPDAFKKRDNFETFIKKIVRDTLTYDQLTTEVIPRNDGTPFEFRATDAQTIRIASSAYDIDNTYSYASRNTINNIAPYRYSGLYSKPYGMAAGGVGHTKYVQLVNQQIMNTYTDDELIFGIRNPRTDIYVDGYGYGEIEQMITVVTSILFAETYNRIQFSQGAHPKGLLNLKGDNWTPETLESFRRQWTAQVVGTNNAWKTPVLQSEGIEWVELQKSNRDMEFNSWLEYLIKIACAIFLIDPAEINFDLHGGVQQTPLFESSQEWKLKASRDRGLKPLLRFIANLINTHIIDKIDDHFVFEFMGLDELTEQEKHEMAKEQLGSYMTMNEVRRSMDLTDIDGGDIPMNPTYLQMLQLDMQKQQMEDQKVLQEQQVKEQQALQKEQKTKDNKSVDNKSVENKSAKKKDYSDGFNKSFFDKKEIIVTLDNWKDQHRSNENA
jgi:hypothetical protein